jgi:hypothetical protein
MESTVIRIVVVLHQGQLHLAMLGLPGGGIVFPMVIIA